MSNLKSFLFLLFIYSLINSQNERKLSFCCSSNIHSLCVSVENRSRSEPDLVAFQLISTNLNSLDLPLGFRVHFGRKMSVAVNWFVVAIVRADRSECNDTETKAILGGISSLSRHLERLNPLKIRGLKEIKNINS